MSSANWERFISAPLGWGIKNVTGIKNEKNKGNRVALEDAMDEGD